MTATYGTAARIIEYGMLDAGLLQDGQKPNSDQVAKNMNRLNDIITFWQSKGIKLWTWLDQSVTLVAGQATYTFMPGGSISMTKPARVISAYYLDSSGNKVPLTSLSWDEYSRLSQVTQQGSLNSYFVNKLATQVAVSFWLVPDATAALGSAHVIMQQQIANFTGITDNLNFPPEWFIALRWALADEICTGQPQTIMDRCRLRADMYLKVLEDWDVEDTPTFFQPSSQMNTSRFN